MNFDINLTAVIVLIGMLVTLIGAAYTQKNRLEEVRKDLEEFKNYREKSFTDYRTDMNKAAESLKRETERFSIDLKEETYKRLQSLDTDIRGVMDLRVDIARLEVKLDILLKLNNLNGNKQT